MRDVVLDASVVTDMLVAADGAQLRSTLAHDAWHAPAHLEIEVVSALRGLVLGGHLGRTRAQEALLDLCDLDVSVTFPHDDALLQAFELMDRMTAYDAAYVVLAVELSAVLVTRDARLARACLGVVDVEEL
ncbi:MAG: type II toxin-antitoxin system VapC family toxin [Nocardioides sp.]|nr:type II toxin-antitoxin system VapC family toxin [Nocardioides sp.]